MGAWLDRNGEAVFGTRPGPVQGIEWGRSTRRAGTVYLHVFDWPTDGRIIVPSFDGAIRRASLLAGGEILDLQPTAGTTTIQGPASAPDPIDTVLVLETEETSDGR